jgi:hypothetical protein
MYLLKLPDRSHGMCSPLPTHAIGQNLMSHEEATQGAAVSESWRRMLELLLLSENSSPSLRNRARAVFIMNGIKSTPITRSCSRVTHNNKLKAMKGGAP